MLGKIKIQKATAAILLASLLLLPSAIQFAHSLEQHEHKICSDFSAHIHKQKTNCSICDFHFSTFQYPTFQNFEVVALHSYATIGFHYFSSVEKYRAHHFYLRGPPQLS